MQTKSHVKSKTSICYIDTQSNRFFLKKEKKKKKRQQRICNNLTGIRLQRQTPPERLHSLPRNFLQEVVCRVFFLFYVYLIVFKAHFFSLLLKLLPRPQVIFSCWSAREVRLDASVTLQSEMQAKKKKKNFSFFKKKQTQYTPT